VGNGHVMPRAGFGAIPTDAVRPTGDRGVLCQVTLAHGMHSPRGVTRDVSSSATSVPDPQDPQGRHLTAQPDTGAVRRDSYTVLVIDDDVAFQQFVSFILRKNGFVVLTASSGADGLEILSSAPRQIQVVLLDYAMTGLTGTETLQRLRDLNPTIKVLAVTVSIPQFVARGFREGVDAYIEKPVSQQELIETIDSLARSKSPGL